MILVLSFFTPVLVGILKRTSSSPLPLKNQLFRLSMGRGRSACLIMVWIFYDIRYGAGIFARTNFLY